MITRSTSKKALSKRSTKNVGTSPSNHYVENFRSSTPKKMNISPKNTNSQINSPIFNIHVHVPSTSENGTKIPIPVQTIQPIIHLHFDEPYKNMLGENLHRNTADNFLHQNLDNSISLIISGESSVDRSTCSNYTNAGKKTSGSPRKMSGKKKKKPNVDGIISKCEMHNSDDYEINNKTFEESLTKLNKSGLNEKKVEHLNEAKVVEDCKDQKNFDTDFVSIYPMLEEQISGMIRNHLHNSLSNINDLSQSSTCNGEIKKKRRTLGNRDFNLKKYENSYKLKKAVVVLNDICNDKNYKDILSKSSDKSRSTIGKDGLNLTNGSVGMNIDRNYESSCSDNFVSEKDFCLEKGKAHESDKKLKRNLSHRVLGKKKPNLNVEEGLRNFTATKNLEKVQRKESSDLEFELEKVENNYENLLKDVEKMLECDSSLLLCSPNTKTEIKCSTNDLNKTPKEKMLMPKVEFKENKEPPTPSDSDSGCQNTQNISLNSKTILGSRSATKYSVANGEISKKNSNVNKNVFSLVEGCNFSEILKKFQNKTVNEFITEIDNKTNPEINNEVDVLNDSEESGRLVIDEDCSNSSSKSNFDDFEESQKACENNLQKVLNLEENLENKNRNVEKISLNASQSDNNNRLNGLKICKLKENGMREEKSVNLKKSDDEGGNNYSSCENSKILASNNESANSSSEELSEAECCSPEIKNQSFDVSKNSLTLDQLRKIMILKQSLDQTLSTKSSDDTDISKSSEESNSDITEKKQIEESSDATKNCKNNCNDFNMRVGEPNSVCSEKFADDGKKNKIPWSNDDQKLGKKESKINKDGRINSVELNVKDGKRKHSCTDSDSSDKNTDDEKDGDKNTDGEKEDDTNKERKGGGLNKPPPLKEEKSSSSDDDDVVIFKIKRKIEELLKNSKSVSNKKEYSSSECEDIEICHSYNKEENSNLNVSLEKKLVDEKKENEVSVNEDNGCQKPNEKKNSFKNNGLKLLFQKLEKNKESSKSVKGLGNDEESDSETSEKGEKCEESTDESEIDDSQKSTSEGQKIKEVNTIINSDGEENKNCSTTNSSDSEDSVTTEVTRLKKDFEEISSFEKIEKSLDALFNNKVKDNQKSPVKCNNFKEVKLKVNKKEEKGEKKSLSSEKNSCPISSLDESSSSLGSSDSFPPPKDKFEKRKNNDLNVNILSEYSGSETCKSESRDDSNHFHLLKSPKGKLSLSEKSTDLDVGKKRLINKKEVQKKTTFEENGEESSGTGNNSNISNKDCSNENYSSEDNGVTTHLDDNGNSSESESHLEQKNCANDITSIKKELEVGKKSNYQTLMPKKTNDEIDIDYVQLKCIEKEMLKRRIAEGKNKKKKNKTQKSSARNNKKRKSDMVDSEVSPSQRKKMKSADEKSSGSSASKKISLGGDYIPLEVSGPTKFSVAPLNKLKPYGSHDAMSFKEKMFFGNRVKRFSNSKELEIYKLKQKVSGRSSKS